jgi:translation initiation factor IF-1
MGDSRDRIELEGIVSTALGNGMFLVKISDNHTVHCTLSGKIRQNNIRIIEGDKVKVEVTPYDLKMGRIVYRTK